ncbi:hypothetical protein [uncultured Roseibium sp.]|uniref:hypothetical protein n=1 Tax=uncultured Roseibium sp. TaxID=1936171 RepID=UPI002618D1B5|nr:hypothetical protein [uncultured Roseibium sp.]
MKLSDKIRSRLLKPVISLYSRFAGSRKETAVLLSGTAKSKPVALVWAFGISELERDAKLQDMKDHLDAFHTVVVVCDSNAFSNLLQMGFRVEAVPSHEEQQSHFCDLPWSTYLSRRISRIRNNWAPDFEFTLAKDPDEFVESCKSRQLTTPNNTTMTEDLEYLEDYAS